MNNNIKTAILISCSDHYGHRLNIIDEALKQNGFETVYITSNFDHTTKTHFKCKVENCVQLPASPYKKNLSAQRIISHRNFAKDVFKYIDSLETAPQVIVSLIPPNFIVHYGAKYKRKHPDVKLFFDVFDMWPETFPIGKLKKILALPFKIWANIRDKNLSSADYILCECEMFRDLLKLPNQKSETVFLCAPKLDINKHTPNLTQDKIELCYLGAINNIISIPDICKLISKISAVKPVTLHIIGTGEREEEFIAYAKEAGAKVEFYGAVYDNTKKDEIMSHCHFGLNIMKSSVCIGLTMKSLDYFKHGLPIINNIPADTKNLVEGRNIGIELDDNCTNTILNLEQKDFLQMRENTEAVFSELFDKSVVLNQVNNLLTKFL